MEQNKSFVQYLREFAAWLHNQPVTRPILALLYSRKALIASALTALIIEYVPRLTPVEGEVSAVAAELVLIVFVWLITSLGYALEDVAAKRGPKDPLVG